MTTIRVRHTADLAPGELDAVRALLTLTFGDELTDDDVEHSLGGLHAMVLDGDVLIAHGAVVLRRLLHGDRALRTGYVEGVAVHPDHRRRGHGRAVMTELGRIITGAYELGALGSTEEAVPLYTGLGWRVWPGTTSVLAPQGRRRTPDEDGSIYVLPVAGGTGVLAEGGDLACDWRGGDVW